MEYEKELTIEKNLIKQLIEGKSQWTLREDIHTVDDLWNNFKKIMIGNNLDIFDKNPLTENEFMQVQNQLKFPTFYDAAKWLMGENGVARIAIRREDANLGTVYPVIFKREDVAGGSSVYEVVHQIRVDKKDVLSRDRRGDVTLLINGLPMIQIELKNRQHPYKDAYRQIKKYLKEGYFRDIFSTVQMFVMSNGVMTKYIAAAGEKQLNEKFMSSWLDQDNNPVTDYLDFARDVLSIPQAHRMVSQYTVLDSERKSLIILRPYQIHAVEAIRRAANPYRQADPTDRNQTPGSQSGFIWHTTGSGKTLTAYKVAHNLTTIPSIRKTIFLVDRKDLDNQTTGAFQAYAEFDTIDVDETDNVWDLTQKLLSEDRSVIVTTRQKLNYVMKRNKEGSRHYKKLHELHMAFVVDECHRAVSPQMQDKINKYFDNPLWYGFTGTPIFAEDAKNSAGDLPKTTAEQYGPCLNKYTIQNAIHDEAVLGFQVEYQTTFDFEDAAYDNGIDIPSGPDEKLKLETEFINQKLTDKIYSSDEHMLKVIDFIINKSHGKFGLNRPKGQAYSAILTTTSIKQAQRYYELFMDVKRGKNDSVKVSDKIKRQLSDFPKVAITYSISENEEESSVNQDKMKESIKDYNEMFDTKYALDSIDAYNRNVNDRLARKKARYQIREEQLDIVIVVERLLTGFDAPTLSTLFIDKKPMRSYGIIQAFSRTNRLFDQQKKFGQIVTFQLPETWKNRVDNAVTLYSGGGGSFVQAPEWQEAEQAFKEALAELRQLADRPEKANELSKKDKYKFLKLFNAFDNAFGDLQVYSEFEKKDLEKDYGISLKEIEDYTGHYTNIKEELKDDDSGDPEDELEIDIDYELRSIHFDQIDEDYILKLMEAVRPDDGALPLQDSSNDRLYKEINAEIERFEKTNPRRAKILKEIWEEYQEDPYRFSGISFTDALNDRVQAQIDNYIYDFSQEWCVKEDELAYFVEKYDLKKDPDDRNDKQQGQDALKKASSAKAYNASHPDAKLGLKYWGTLLKAAHDLVEDKVKPLIER